jgi:hypothetical protein
MAAKVHTIFDMAKFILISTHRFTQIKADGTANPRLPPIPN